MLGYEMTPSTHHLDFHSIEYSSSVLYFNDVCIAAEKGLYKMRKGMRDIFLDDNYD